MEREEGQVVAFQEPSNEQMQCVGSMEVQRTLDESALGFICGSLPVPTATPPKAFSSTALVYQNKRTIAPHYRLLPAETDLNALATVGETGELDTGKTIAQKCDTLAASALSGHGDGIDVIAPVDILKQIFKTPYSKARVSVAVHRIGRTLILNSGPDEERETLDSQKKISEKLLYSRFIRHSTQPPSAPASAESSKASPWHVTAEEHGDDERNLCATLRLEAMHDGKISWDRDENQLEDVDAEYREQETGTQKSPDGFLRVLFWQFQNLRMLLGSDLLVFSNDKHVAVSLHLVDIKRRVSPLMWLDTWLDNVMASVPELAICYHHDGVVQGYELLKTDDIFSLKGLAKDGSVFFQPHVVQQNALSVLRFLQENCKQDPGTYWLFKSSGEDVLQLYDLTGVSKSRKKNENGDTLPFRNVGLDKCTLPLAMLLYRTAYALSRSQESNDICKCAKLFRKCLEFLDDEEHLIIRAITHEQVARLILNCCKEHGSSMKPVLLLESYDGTSAPQHSQLEMERPAAEGVCIEELSPTEDGDSTEEDSLTLCPTEESTTQLTESSDSVSARLAAVHHISEAILSLRCQRQLQDITDKRKSDEEVKQFPLCLCGDIDCITFYDISSSEFGVLMDHKLRELVLMLGESYLALGEAYSDQGELSQTVKAAQLACSVYASLDQLKDAPSPYGCRYCSPGITRKPVKKLVPLKAGTRNDLRKGRFWGQAWRLIGDIYLKNLMLLSDSTVAGSQKEELQMAEEIVREVKRLRKKSGQKPGCGVCSSSDCSCHMERIASGSTATSSSERNERTSSSRLGFKHRKGGGPSLKELSENEEPKPPDEETFQQVCRNHVCFHLKRVLTKDLKLNFLAAVDCYDASIYALTDVSGASQELEAALRKKGWACNELARLILASEDISLAETAYKAAAAAFEGVEDTMNVVLVNCNLGHALRSTAEKMVALLSVTSLTKEKFESVSSQAEEFYQKALKYYRAAKAEVTGLSNPELEEEVITQLANTFFRLGTFVMNQQISAVLSLGNEEDSSVAFRLQSLFSGNSAMLEALLLYQSIPRPQEAAFTHYKIGYQLKQCLQITKLKTEYIGVQNMKYYAGIADHHLRKALVFYQPQTHPSMFLDILQEECDLCMLTASLSSSEKMLDQALSYMLEGWRAFSGEQKLPSKTSSAFLNALQSVLKNILAAAITNRKLELADQSDPALRVQDVARLKKMYGISLRSTSNSLPSDIKELHALWTEL